MQMRNEWRSNVWMMVELFVVGLVLWAVFLILFGLGALHKDPVGADFHNIYVGDFGYIRKDSEKFRPYDEDHGYMTDIEILMANLRSNPYVEIVGAGSNALPYNYNYSGSGISTEIDGKLRTYHGNWRRMTPETVRAFRLSGLNGESTEDLAEMIGRGELILGTVEWGEPAVDPLKWKGTDVRHAYDSSRVYHVGAVMNGIRRTDYEPTNGMIISDFEKLNYYSNVIVRVREGMGRQFLSSLGENDLEFGNVYVSNMQSLDDIKDDAHRDMNVLNRNMAVCAFFVLVSVFLGFLGTFWYRTQQRVPELALRKVNGATNADLFRRFLGEGLLLLVLPALLLVPAGCAVIRFLNSMDENGSDSAFQLDLGGLPIGPWIIWTALATSVVTLALMILAGIWMPARKAMKVEPAIALKDQ